MCETTDLIKKMAHDGCSKTSIRMAIGNVPRRSFNDIVDTIGPVKFYSGKTYTVRGFHGTSVQIIEHFKLRISPSVVKKRLNLGLNLDDCFFASKYGRVMTVRGFTGSCREIIKHFKLPITPDCVDKRIKRGVSLEEAYFSPVEVVQVRNMRPDSKAKRVAELQAAYAQPLF